MNEVHEERGERAGRRTGLLCAAPLLGVAVALALGGAGCNQQDDRLSGSLGQVYDLSFSETRARLYSSEFAVEYVRDDGQVPVRVVVERGEDEVSAGSIDLGERGTVVGRVDERRLPAFQSGTLDLEEFGSDAGATVRGEFDATFEAGDSTYSLEGRFQSALDVVDGSLGYAFEDAGGGGDVEGDGYESGADASGDDEGEM